MPLKKGKRNIGRNISAEMKAGKPRKQAIAIALDYARRHAREAEIVPKETGLPGAAASPNLLHGPGSLLGTLGAGRAKRTRVKSMDLLTKLFPGLQSKESKGESAGAEGHGGYLVTDAEGKKHLPTEKNGKRDRGLMGSAWAALHEGYRGKPYEGPGKAEAIAKLKKMYAEEGVPVPGKTKDADLLIAKDASGKFRWTMITSSAFEDRDGEVISEAAHAKDIAAMNATKQFGYLGWRHVGEPSDKNPSPQLPLIVLGNCDFAAMHKEARIESGTFVNEEIPAALAPHAKELSSSLTFYGDPDADGVYQNIHTAGRCVTFRENAANLLATFGVQKENTPMEDLAIQQLTTLIGKEQVDALIQSAELRTKAAREAGLRKKEARMHQHGDKQHAHAIPEGATEDQHDHTPEQIESLKPVEAEKKSKEAAMLESLKTKELDPALMDLLAAICAKLDLIQLELEQAEDREGVQEPAGYEQVEQAMAGVQKEFKAANATYAAGLAKVKEVADELAKVKASLAALTGDLPKGLSGYRPSQSDDNKLSPEVAAWLDEIQKKESSGDPSQVPIVDWVLKGMKPTV